VVCVPTVAVCVKYVPDVEQVRVDRETGRLITEGVPMRVNELDKNALEEAVRIKEAHGWKVIAITVGPEGAKMALREALAIGADEAYLACDEAFEGLDTLGVATVLARAIEAAGGADLVLCGEVSLDSFSGQVGPKLAELLNAPCVTCARALKLQDGKVLVESALEDRYEEVAVPLPAVVTVTREINTPRIPGLRAIMMAARKPIKMLRASDLGLSDEELKAMRSHGLVEVVVPAVERKKVRITGESPEEIAEKLVEALEKEGVIT